MRQVIHIAVMFLIFSCGQNNNQSNSQTESKKDLIKSSEISIDKFIGKWKNNGKSAGEVFTGSTVTITKEAENIIVKLNSGGEILQNTGEFTDGKIKVSLSFAGETNISYSEENGQPHIYVFGAKMDKMTAINIASSDGSDVPIPQVKLTKVADYRKVHPRCNEDLVPEGYGLDCGVLGNKGIEFYWANSENENLVSGYTVVNNNKTPFEGKLISKGIKKASGRKDVIEFDETVYTYVLREPKTSNKNGVFQLKMYRNDTYEYGEGTWVSYDGMLYREIFIYDKSNPDY